MKLTTTLDLLHKAGACTSGYKTLITALGAEYPDEKPIDLLTILDTNGLDDALWALCATAENCDMVARLIAADFAEQVLPIWQKYSKDDRPALAIQAARDFAHGRIYRQEMAAARAAAGDAAWDAARDAARDAAWDAAGAAARDAAWDAAGAAARDAARAAAWDAAGAAAGAAAWAAAGAAAGAAARARQREIFISYLQPDGALDDTR
jgi:hypothetical protein